MIRHDATIDADIVSFDFGLYSFRKWFCDRCETANLEMLHILRHVTPDNYPEIFDELAKASVSHLQSLGSICKEFIRKELVPTYGQVAGIQPFPTVRFHFAVSSPELELERNCFLSEGAARLLGTYYDYRPAIFHRDKDYGLIPGAMNLWIPVSPAIGTGALWLGSGADNGRDARPVELYPGQALCFDGAQRWHGALWNTSDITRLSLDVRVLFHGGAWSAGSFGG
jgi:hypothetical protein